MSYNVTTTNLADFAAYELETAGKILIQYSKGTYHNFYDDGVQLMKNNNSGNVFLTNSDFQVLMLNGDKLEQFYNLPYSGEEGFLEDLLNEYYQQYFNDEEFQYLIDLNNGDWTFILNGGVESLSAEVLEFIINEGWEGFEELILVPLAKKLEFYQELEPNSEKEKFIQLLIGDYETALGLAGVEIGDLINL